ncbi:lonely Cys domain-containing protein, partial [Streptomyces sp. SID3212]|uniref:lonely Cys domain-containing protein n=1 Tax=Streptomyces sp. SID3212 TaxID=2690259 RepID=UPI00136D509F
MDINFPPALREFLEVWVGASVASGNARDGFDSSRPYYRLSDDIGTMSDAMKSAILTSGDSLPPQVAEEFVAALRLFVDDGGRNHLADFAKEVRTIGDRQVDRSIKLSEAKYQILLEFILMNLELALIAALAFFTGGTSLAEIAAVRSRTALSMLLILQRLGHAVPTPLSALLEAIQEAFVTFASQVISMVSPDDPRRRRRDFDWGDIGQSAVAGALAGAFAGIFSGAAAPFFRDLFKKNSPWKDLFELPASFINEGQAETFAVAFTKLIYQGTFSLDPATFVSAGTSGLLTEAASTTVEYGGKGLNHKFFQDLDFGQGVNHPPPGGREGSGAGDHTPLPRRTVDTGPDGNVDLYDPPADYGVNSVPRPSTASADDAYVAPYDPGPGLAYDPAPDLDLDPGDFASSVSDFSDGSSVFSEGSDVDDTLSVSDYGLDQYQQPGPPIGTGPGHVAKPPYSYDLPGQADGEIADAVFSTLNPQPSTMPGDLGIGAVPNNLFPVGATAPVPAFTPVGGQTASGNQDTERFFADDGVVTPDEALSDAESVRSDVHQPPAAGADTPGSPTGRPGSQNGVGSAQDETVREGSVDEDGPASFGEDPVTGGTAPAAAVTPSASAPATGQQAATPPPRPHTSSVEPVTTDQRAGVSDDVPADDSATDGTPGSAEVSPSPERSGNSDLRTSPSPEESPRTGSEIPPPYRPVPTESQDTHAPAADTDRDAGARDDTDTDKGKGRATFLTDLPESLPGSPDPDAVADARDEHADALRTYADAHRAAESVRQLPPDAATGSDTTVLRTATEREQHARGQLEEAEARLIQLGVDPYDLGPRRGFGSADQVPVVRRDEAARHWIAQHVTAEDLPPNPPALDHTDTITPAELEAAGITPGPLSLDAGQLTPLDQVRLLMVRSGSWHPALDAVAANASRRIWRTASADFEGTDPADRTETETETESGTDTAAARAWDTAVGLVLPLELHPVLADSRYAGDEYRDAVRQVAAHLATEGADHRTAVHVAGRLRHGLGLRPRGPGGAPVAHTPGWPGGGSPTSADHTPGQPDPATSSQEAPATSSQETPATSSRETPAHPLLVGVFGSAIGSSRLYPALRATLDHLDRLRQSDPALRGGPLDLDALARRVLLLDPTTPVTGAHHGELFRVAMDEAVESAASLAALAAFHLRLRGVLSPTRAVSDPSGFQGRDWTGSPRKGLDLTTTGKVSYRPDGLLERGDVRTARWHGPGTPQPYVVTAEGAHDHVVVRGFDGAPRRVPIDVFAELLALDPVLAALPPDVPVLLLIPGAGDRGLDLPRRTADRIGRRLWSANGLVKLTPQPDPALPRTISLLSGPGLRRADWIPSDPGQVPAHGTYENTPGWERGMVSHTIVSDSGPIGRGVFDDAEAPAVLEHLSHATEATEHWHRNPATEVWTRDDEPLPFAGKPVYVFAAHGRTGETHVPLEGKTVKVARERETGGMLKRRPSLARLPREYGILMEECWTAPGKGLTTVRGAAPDAFVPDPLATIGKAQHAANETGRTVYGATRGVGLQFLPGRGYVHVSLTDARGRRGRWVEQRPEPTGDALDDRARAAGLHHGPGPATDAVRYRTLRLVRALRLTFGPAVEDESGYGDLLGGIGALEALRAADPVLGGFGLFSLDLFERAARAARARRSDAADGDLGPDDFRRLLAEAAGVVTGQPGTLTGQPGAVPGQPGPTLGDFADLPHVTGAARRLGGLADPDAEAVRVLGLSGGPAAVGEPERARLFWATVKALEWESRTPDPDVLTAKVLHLDRPDPARREELFLLVARAAAAGRDPYNPTELAAFHLEVLGALGPETQLVDAKGVPTGRNWSRPAPNADGAPNAGGVTNAGVVTDRAVVAAPAQEGGYRPV